MKKKIENLVKTYRMIYNMQDSECIYIQGKMKELEKIKTRKKLNEFIQVLKWDEIGTFNIARLGLIEDLSRV